MTYEDALGAPAPVTAPKDAFRFGRNWQRFINEHLDPARERTAADSLRDLLGDVAGKRFIDIGSGSGLFSLCAHRAGAREVVSLDVDPDAVAATTLLQRRAGSPESWRVMQASILDERLVDHLLPGDIVYSWGVLHHTGDMHLAIKNAARLVAPGGTFAIAIYNRVSSRWLNSERWWRVKRAYNHSPRWEQKLLEYACGLYWALGCLKSRENPIRVARQYRQSRGMALWTDIVDWVGGYPYEYATVDEIARFCEAECGLHLTGVTEQPPGGTGNNEFVFVRDR